jgi:peptidoglycan/LPS O-acetylase OafA/YrhL
MAVHSTRVFNAARVRFVRTRAARAAPEYDDPSLSQSYARLKGSGSFPGPLPSRTEQAGVRDHVRSGTEAIDGLRGIAIVLVVFYHTWLFSWFTPELRLFSISVPVDILPRNGYLGVNLFFTISGFVLFFPHALRALGAVAGDGGTHAPESTARFAARRFIKIAPSYAIALIATFFFSIEYLSVPDLWRNLGIHALFIQNAFSDGFGTANSVFWSLAVEVQFYVAFPLVARAFRAYPFATAAAMTAIALAYRYGVAGCCLGVETISRAMPAYLDLFAAGMLAAYLVVWIRMRRPGIARHAWAFTAGAALCALGVWEAFVSSDAVQYVALGPQRWDLAHRTVLALAFGGLAVTSCFAIRPWRAILANPVLVFLSVVSYNVYLWHTLLMIWLWKHDVPRALTPNPHDDDHWKLPYIALGWSLTLLVATAITYFVERPLLGFVRRAPFAFDYARIGRALNRTPRGVSSETRT